MLFEKWVFVTLVLALNPLQSFAAEEAATDTWASTLGPGTFSAPAYSGIDQNRVPLVPLLSAHYGDRPFASIVDGTGSNFVRYQRWKVGVIAKYNSGRREDGESLLYIGNKSTKDLKGPGDVKGHAEFGGFLSRVELRQYMDVHEGMTGQAGFKFNGSARLFEQNIMYSIGPKITFADRDYINAYFSINQEQSIASGLNEYEYENKEQGFSSGLNISLLTYGFHGTLVVALKNSVSVAGFAGIDRITNDVAESPLIQSRGAENQAIAGLLVNYSL